MEATGTLRGPIYIGGPDRCGKTTMRAFLVSNPRIAIPAVGSNMWAFFYGQYGDLARPRNLERCLEAMLRYKHVRFLRPDGDRIRREFLQGERTYARLFALFLLHYAEAEGRPRWGAQCGLVERYADQILRAYPGARMIHMVRDPRDRYEASLALWPEGRGRAGAAVARWRYSVRLGFRNLSRYPQSYLMVRYESMVCQPEETLRRVCAFLDEEYSPAMLAMDGAPRHRERLAQGKDLAPGQPPVSPDYIGLFRGTIPPEEIAFIQTHAGREMAALDYPPEPVALTGRRRLRYPLVDQPQNLARMLVWQAREAVQHHLPGFWGRKPRPEMILDGSTGAYGTSGIVRESEHERLGSA